MNMATGKAPPVIHWFRQDLRLADNPALEQAAMSGAVLPLYILDEAAAGASAMGAASRVWLHQSLQQLDASLGGGLHLLQGDACTQLLRLCQQHGIARVYWNRSYEPWRRQQDQQIEKALTACGVQVITANAQLLWEPWQTLKRDGTPYRVFTPFYRNACQIGVMPPRPAPALTLARCETPHPSLTDLALLPAHPWARDRLASWQPGEAGAQTRLEHFAVREIHDYRQGRDFPSHAKVSRLSPHLHFGELSPRQIWHRVQQEGDTADIEHFQRELAWREFSYALLYHFPTLPTKNLQPGFDTLGWQTHAHSLACWQRGQTGYPLVDAAMRELWTTGYMHNRMRMVAGSFLVKNLLLDWRLGAAWFWDCLFDADLANNSASWQWVAGCGADAAPFFRIFNPVLQGKKFDPDGRYTRRFVPELAHLPARYLFAPWTAPEHVLDKAGISLGDNYPLPIVDLQQSRERALMAFKVREQNRALPQS